jgi:hypothetical protein
MMAGLFLLLESSESSLSITSKSEPCLLRHRLPWFSFEWSRLFLLWTLLLHHIRIIVDAFFLRAKVHFYVAFYVFYPEREGHLE